MILLDTCAFLWLNEDPPRLPPSVLEKIRSTSIGYRFVSAMSALEIAVKVRGGRLVVPGAGLFSAPLPRILDTEGNGGSSR